MNESRGPLLSENGPEVPVDSNGSWEIALGGGKGVGSGGTFEEEEREESKDLGPNTGVVVSVVNTKGLEGGDDEQDGCPSVVKGEGQVDEHLIREVLGRVVLFHNIVDVRYRGTDEKSEDECKNIMVLGPQVDVDGIEDAKESKTP